MSSLLITGVLLMPSHSPFEAFYGVDRLTLIDVPALLIEHRVNFEA